MRYLVVLGLASMLVLSACGSNSSNKNNNAASAPTTAPATVAAVTSATPAATAPATASPSASSSQSGYPGYGASVASATTSSATAASATAAASGATVSTASVPSVGTVLVNAAGRTLYHFDKDTATSSACTGGCTSIWPPLTIASGTPVAGSGISGTLGVLTRTAGSKQVTYKNQPLYTYSGDSGPGQAKGNGIAGLWHVATP